MTPGPPSPPVEWRIRVRGLAGLVAQASIPDCRIHHEGGLTTLEGVLQPARNLGPLLIELQGLGLEIVEVSRVSPVRGEAASA